jgi:hypothetical protein
MLRSWKLKLIKMQEEISQNEAYVQGKDEGEQHSIRRRAEGTEACPSTPGTE